MTTSHPAGQVVSFVTSRDPKGRHVLDALAVTYDRAKLDENRAQRLNDRTAELQAGFAELVGRLSDTNEFEDEQVQAAYGYPSGYSVLPIRQQVDALAKLFPGLSLGGTIEYIEKKLPKDLPAGAEGWFAVPRLAVIAKLFFPDVTDPAEQYVQAVNLVLAKIAESRSFYNYREGEIDTDHLRQSARTIAAIEKLEAEQTGDVLIIPAQFGKRHGGRSVRRARAVFAANEFGLGVFHTACMLLVHPKRMQKWEELDWDCSGDEFSSEAGGRFGGAPYFGFRDGRVGFRAVGVSYAVGYMGSASAFSTQ